MDGAAPNQVVVVGRDAALWLAANVLQAALRPTGVQVTAVELPTRLTAADVHATQPALEALHVRLGVDEAQLLSVTGGSFSLGQNFTDAAGTFPSFLHAHGSYGALIDGREFFPYWVKGRGLGLQAPLETFCLTAEAARHGRFLLLDEVTEGFGRLDYGYHLPALAYAGFLKGLAARQGVVVHEAAAVGALLDAAGDIAAVEIGEGRRIRGDLFLDASGPEGLLIGNVLGVGGESWRAHSPVDRVLAAVGPRLAAAPPYAELRASPGGWTGLHPTQVSTLVVQAYASGACSDEAALREAADVSRLRLADPIVRPLAPARRERAWAANCVAIGEAACALDPLHGLDLHVVQLGLVHLLGLFPVAADAAPERAEYNRTVQAAYERLRDFQCAHYGLARYAGEFWSTALETPPELAHKLATFRARGEVAMLENETFPADSWRALLVGHGLVPESYDPGIDRTPAEEVKREFRRILGAIKDQVLRQPTHERYLGSYCRAPVGQGARRAPPDG